MLKHCMVVSGIDLSKCLGTNEEVLATLKCKGFDGFPDFGESNDQQRTGQCQLSLVAASSSSNPRIVFTHMGALRSMSADEELCDCKICCAKTTNYKWAIEREQVTGLAVVDCETQLLGISSETVDKIGMTKVGTYIQTDPTHAYLYK